MVNLIKKGLLEDTLGGSKDIFRQSKNCYLGPNIQRAASCSPSESCVNKPKEKEKSASQAERRIPAMTTARKKMVRRGLFPDDLGVYTPPLLPLDPPAPADTPADSPLPSRSPARSRPRPHRHRFASRAFRVSASLASPWPAVLLCWDGT